MIKVETHGFEALEKTFKNFAKKDKRNILISAFRKAVKPMAAQGKANAPVGRTGNLRRSIGVVPMRGEVAIFIGARVNGGNKGSHGHLVEDGTVDRFYISKNGVRHNTGKMNPNAGYARFFQKAVDATQGQAIDTVASEWYKAIDRFIVRSNKKDR